jgi:RNA polymerase sigma-70 factor (ECF subfamily)
MTDEQIIEAFKMSDIRSLGFLWEKHYDRLIRYASRLLKDDFFVEDVVVEAFLKVWKLRASFIRERAGKITDVIDYHDLVDRIRGYLYISVRHNCIALHRKQITYERLRKYILLDLTEDYSDSSGMEYELSYVENVQQLQEAVLLLPERSKIVFELFYSQRLSYKEIALIMGLSVQTVRNQKTYAITNIKARIFGIHRTEVNKAS